MNYFEMLGIPCEGKMADNPVFIKNALEKWKVEKDSALGAGGNKAAVQAELAEYPNMQRLLTDAAFRKQQADELKAKRLAQLDSIIDIMSKSSLAGKKITKARTQRIGNLLGLEILTTRRSFKAKGFTEIPGTVANVSDLLTAETSISVIDEELENIRQSLRQDPTKAAQAPKEIALVKDLYQYLAVMEGKSISEAGEYAIKNASDLTGKFEALARLHTRANHAPESCYKNIEAKAEVILKNDKEKTKYDNYLKLQSIMPMLDLLKTIPDSVKIERSFAEGCIAEIRSVFSDENDAIAVYNRYAGLTDEKYEKESTTISVMCTCRIISEFPSQEAAEKAKCPSCGTELFKVCPQCQKKVPAVADFCACGFFMKGLQSFALHRERFDIAIKGMNLEKAKDELAQAKASNPAAAEIPGMENQLKKLITDIERPLRDIEDAIGAKLINKARNLIITLKAARPGVEIRQYEDQVNEALRWADQQYAILSGITDYGKGLEIAEAISEKVADHVQTNEWQCKHPPKPVQNVDFTADHKEISCVLSWTDHPDNRFVKYSIVRKESAFPRNENDGIQIANGLTVKSFKDTTAAPGKIYGYAVFAVRREAFSSPALLKNGVLLLKNIDNVSVNISPSGCMFAWNDIIGSAGVQIKRSDDGGINYNVVAPCVKGMFNDSSVQNNTRYKYALASVWEIGGKSYTAPIELFTDVFIEQKPARVDIHVDRVGIDGNCTVSWKSEPNGKLTLLWLMRGKNPVKDQVYTADMLKTLGTIVVSDIPVAKGNYSWYAPKGKEMNIAAFRSFGTDYVCGLPAVVSTVPATEIDMEKTKFANDTLRIYIKNIPSDVTEIYYLVSEEQAEANVKMAAESRMSSVNINELNRNGCITIEHLRQVKFKISVIAKYGSGGETYYSPVAVFDMSNEPKSKVKYWIEWQEIGWVKKTRTRKGAKLHVSVEGSRIPGMDLCCRRDGKMIFNYVPNNTDILTIMKIEPEEGIRGDHVFDIPESSLSPLITDSYIHLYLNKNEESRYETPICMDASSRKLP